MATHTLAVRLDKTCRHSDRGVLTESVVRKTVRYSRSFLGARAVSKATSVRDAVCRGACAAGALL
jgi:hypothetical protein